MIAHAPLYGLTQVEQIITGFIAGFHHGISRKIIRAYRYANMASAEDWIMIRKLSTILALAEASDLTYEQIVTNVEVTLAENVAVMILTTTPNGRASPSATTLRRTTGNATTRENCRRRTLLRVGN